MLSISEKAKTFQDGDPLGEQWDKVIQVLQDLMPYCKENCLSKFHASGHVSLFRSVFWMGQGMSLYSVKIGWASGLERSSSLEKEGNRASSSLNA